MRYIHSVTLAGLAIWLTGCASAPKVVVQERVGPCERVVVQDAREGCLRVFSARERSPIGLNVEEFLWNNDFGKNEFLYESAYSDYTILGQDGSISQRVRNGRGLNNETPARVMLPPGFYQVEAEAEDLGGMTITMVVPFVIEAGQTTSVHLEPRWNRSGGAMDSDGHVRLADGRIIGCRAESLLSQHAQSTGSIVP